LAEYHGLGRYDFSLKSVEFCNKFDTFRLNKNIFNFSGDGYWVSILELRTG